MACVSENSDQGNQLMSDCPRSSVCLPTPDGFLQKFRLYQTRSNFYMLGRDKSRRSWKVLKIDRLEPSELNISEDSTTYTERECSDLLRRINEGNKMTGGLKFVTTCYGIVGFIKFFGPYYMLIITKRRKVGTVCGHDVYAVSKTEIIQLSYSSVGSSEVNSRHETRYKKLFCMFDLTRDFYFSYSYHVMRSLQKNLCEIKTGTILYESIFVWNEFLTRGIRDILQNTIWTVALIYGFFKQATFPTSGRDVKLTLIARRSRHYAGTRYLKRGVNEKGSVANDVETEQIMMEDVPEGMSLQISSVVQNRGSIPLFWSQEASQLNLKPDIILSKKDQTYEATKLHFEGLVNRYENPIIICNLIKTSEKKPRESILHAEFANAIEFLNKDLSEENQLKFLHWDFHKYLRSNKAKDALLILGKVATYVLTLTGIFYCQATPEMLSDLQLRWTDVENAVTPSMSDVEYTPTDNETEDSLNSDKKSSESNSASNMILYVKPQLVQKGVLRTNCIDCLDRTNVAQYAYGLAALGHQLHALGIASSTKLDLEDPLAEKLMGFYEKMGDTLAQQYGGSAAHNKIFSERRGHWKAAIRSQEFFRTLQRYYSNAYMDAEKQRAINVFLGNFNPMQNKLDPWELGSDQHSGLGHRLSNGSKSFRPLFRRSLSDGNILNGNRSPSSSLNDNKEFPDNGLLDESVRIENAFESTPSSSKCKLSYSRCTSSMPAKMLFSEMQRDKYPEIEIDSNFLDLDWLSSSCEEELLERSIQTVSPVPGISSENMISELSFTTEITPASTSESYASISQTKENTRTELGSGTSINEFSDSFVQWVTCGEAFSY